MEFLDPKAKKKKSRQLFIGYGLIAVLISLATYILLATALGYEVFTSNGQLVQNGLVFIESEPVSASVSVDGKLENDKTGSKLALKSGDYVISLDEPGYTSWSKKIAVEGGQVRFFTYPRLFPLELTTEKLADLSVNVGFISQSLDKRWLVVQQNALLPAIQIFDLEKDKPEPTSVVLPSILLINQNGNFGTFEVVEWSDNDRFFLLHQVLPDGRQSHLLIDRENIDASQNLGSVFGVEPTKAEMINGDPEKFYLYFATGGIIRIGDLKAKTVGVAILDQVLTFKTNGDNLIFYATTLDATPGKVALKVYDRGDIFSFGELIFDASNRYFLNMKKFDGSWYYAAGSASGDRMMIYRNPLNFISSKIPRKPSLLTTLKVGSIEEFSSSTNNRFLLAKSGQKIAVYDAEEDRSYIYELPYSLDPGSKLLWVDEAHLQAVSGGKTQIMEFDGLNSQPLLAVYGAKPSYFSSDDKKLFAITPFEGGTSALVVTGLVVP